MTREEIDALADELTITLRKPIVVGKATYAEITVREPTVAQLKQITAQSGVDSTITAITLTADVPAGVAAQMAARDFMRAKEFFDGFLESPAPVARSPDDGDET